MFFLLSKILAFIITPLVWITFLLFMAVFMKSNKIRAKSLLAALCLFLIFGNVFITNEALRLWEVAPIENDNIQKYEAGIVLSGMAWYDFDLKRIQFYLGADRLFQAIRLYKEGSIKKIILTGGSGSIVHKDQTESKFLREYMLSIGIPDSVIVMEALSKNTYENAVETKKLVQKNNIKGKLLLITSARHMRRSVACFQKVGLEVTPYSVDCHASSRSFYPNSLIIPRADRLDEWEGLLHEMVGYFIYRLMGYV